jgi:hypothetical protein
MFSLTIIYLCYFLSTRMESKPSVVWAFSNAQSHPTQLHTELQEPILYGASVPHQLKRYWWLGVIKYQCVLSSNMYCLVQTCVILQYVLFSTKVCYPPICTVQYQCVLFSNMYRLVPKCVILQYVLFSTNVCYPQICTVQYQCVLSSNMYCLLPMCVILKHVLFTTNVLSSSMCCLVPMCVILQYVLFSTNVCYPPICTVYTNHLEHGYQNFK